MVNKKKSPAKPSVSKNSKSKSTSSKKKVAQTTVNTIAENLPDSVMKNEYVRRTVDILNDTEKSASRLSKKTSKQLGGVVSDLREDVSSSVNERVDRLIKKSKIERVKEKWNQAYEVTLKTVDDLLDSIGLVRKTAVE